MMKLYFDTDFTTIGIGLNFYTDYNIHTKYKFSIDFQILMFNIQLSFYKKIEYTTKIIFKAGESEEIIDEYNPTNFVIYK